MMLSQFNAFTFGTRRFDEAEEFTAPTAVAYLEGRSGLTVGVFEHGLSIRKAFYSSEAGTSPVVSVDFELLETGCGAFTLTVCQPPGDLPIDRGDRIEIALMGSPQPWYSGRVTDLPGVDTGAGEFRYRGYGYFAELETVLVDETYPDGTVDTIEEVLEDLADTYLASLDIVFFPDRVAPVGYTLPASSLRFDHNTLKDAFAKLAELAGDYVFGVNAARELFFTPKPGYPVLGWKNKACHWLGYTLGDFSLTEKARIYNRLYVKAGRVTGGTNYLAAPVSDADSIAFFGVREKTASAPQLQTDAEATAWAENEVQKTAWPVISAKAKDLTLDGWVTSKADMLEPPDYMRVSLPRAGLASDFFQPQNGYGFDWSSIATAQLYDTNWLKLTFDARISGPLGLVEFRLARVGDPGDLTIEIKRGATSLATLTVDEDTVLPWLSWVKAAINPVIDCRKAVTYTIELSAVSGDASNYYQVYYSTADSPYSGAYYSSTNSGTSWSENTGRGLFFRTYLAHRGEYALQIKKVVYSASPDSGIRADIDLGGIDTPLEDHILDLVRRIRAEEYLQQANVKELA